MTMTHYMELLASNQPWNLLIFMAIPVILAETVAITELYLLFTKNTTTCIKKLNRVCGIILGIYFLGVFIYLFKNAVIPLTLTGAWRGWVDVLAVGSYLAGVVPLFGISLLELNIILKNKDQREKDKMHAIFVGIFLVVAHIAMIFGMVNPEIFTTTHTTMAPMTME